MRRLLILSTILGIVATVGSGQLSVSTVLKGGLAGATFKGDDIQGNEAVSQYAAGMAVELDFPGPVSIQPEILYNIKGSRILAGTPQPRTIKLTYVDIPVLVRYNLSVPVIDPYICAGPSIGILLAAKGKDEGTLASQPEEDMKALFAETDYGIIVGAGICVPLIITDLSLEARYYFGLNKLDKSGTLKQYNRVISVLAGISL